MTADLLAVRWDRTSTEIIGVFPPKSLRWLGRQLTFFEDVLEARAKGYAHETTLDPTAAVLGMPDVRGLPDYPPLRVALDRWFPEGMPKPFRLWWEPDVLKIWHRSLQVMRTSMPAEGNVVVMSHAQAHAWTMVLPPFHAIFAVLRGVLPLPPDTGERARSNLGPSYQEFASRADLMLADMVWHTYEGVREQLGYGGPIR